MTETESEVEGRIRVALSRVLDPEIRKPITELDMVGDVAVTADGSARVAVKLTIVGCPAADTIERDVRAATAGVTGVSTVDVDVSVMTPVERKALTEKLRAGRARRGMQFGPDSLTRVYAVTSGKGGVGKSTVTANLAVALAERGLAVGIEKPYTSVSPSGSSTPTCTASRSPGSSGSWMRRGRPSSRPGSTT